MGLNYNAQTRSLPAIREMKIVNSEAKIAGHYTRGGLEQTILQAVAKAGKDAARPTVEDFAPVDEFHVGGIEATKELAAQMDLRPELRLLDVGCGIGGPARYFAAEHGCKVVGIDLTEEFVQVATSLTGRLKLDHLVEFHQASALALPFGPSTFDRAYMIHVGMNISDKTAVFSQVHRVLKPGGLFAIFDFVRAARGPLRFPVPWALTEDTSFVAEVNEYCNALEAAGFRVTHKRGRRTFAIEFIARGMARMAQGGPPALGIHLLVGEAAKPMLNNVLTMMEEGILDPVELCAVAI
jgi:ubiquinone/menaquinone biosynthesis C-methylase UbiE